MTHHERFVGDEYPSIGFTWYDWDPITKQDVVADLATGWTGTVRIWHPDRGPTVVLRVGEGCTMDDADPNHIWTPTAADDAALVTSWGKTLPADGTVFLIEPYIFQTATPTVNRRWRGQPDTMRLFPAQTLPS